MSKCTPISTLLTLRSPNSHDTYIPQVSLRVHHRRGRRRVLQHLEDALRRRLGRPGARGEGGEREAAGVAHGGREGAVPERGEVRVGHVHDQAVQLRHPELVSQFHSSQFHKCLHKMHER